MELPSDAAGYNLKTSLQMDTLDQNDILPILGKGFASGMDVFHGDGISLLEQGGLNAVLVFFLDKLARG